MEKVYEAFNEYPWDTDKVFQLGLGNIVQTTQEHDDLVEQARLLKAKHFYFCRFQENFNLELYLKYQQEKLNEKINQQQFDRLEKYDYNHDQDYTKGLPNIIRGWLKDQSVNGLWDKERLDLEFSKAKAFYYVARIEKVDLNAYFTYKLKKEQENKPACPFANKWLNKNKLGPVKQTNGSTFIVTEKTQGPETITLSSPKSKNILTVDRLKQLEIALNNAHLDDEITSIFITTTVNDTSNMFEINERIETKDTKIMSCGLAYNQTMELTSNLNQQQISMNNLSTSYYNLIQSILIPKQPKLIITFSNGQIPLNAIYLTLFPGFKSVITEHSLLILTLELSHSPIPPLLLLCSNKKPGMDLYLALAAPEYAKLRGPEILFLGLADTFVPESKLADLFETTKNMAICSSPYTNQSIQLGLSIHHTYSGPNRLSVWEKNIETVFGKEVDSLQDLKQRLELHDTNWSKTILNHWNQLPPVLLNVIFKAVKLCQTLNQLEILNLEKKLNEKWRQSMDYQQWLQGKSDWIDTCVDFYFEEDDEVSSLSLEPLVYQVEQEVEQEEEFMVCPVTGQKSAGSGCPVNGNVENKCPVTGQKENGQEKCPASAQLTSCPVTGQTSTGCPVTAVQDMSGKCPVSGQQSTTEGCPFSKK